MGGSHPGAALLRDTPAGASPAPLSGPSGASAQRAPNVCGASCWCARDRERFWQLLPQAVQVHRCRHEAGAAHDATAATIPGRCERIAGQTPRVSSTSRTTSCLCLGNLLVPGSVPVIPTISKPCGSRRRGRNGSRNLHKVVIKEKAS